MDLAAGAAEVPLEYTWPLVTRGNETASMNATIPPSNVERFTLNHLPEVRPAFRAQERHYVGPTRLDNHQ